MVLIMNNNHTQDVQLMFGSSLLNLYMLQMQEILEALHVLMEIVNRCQKTINQMIKNSYKE